MNTKAKLVTSAIALAIISACTDKSVDRTVPSKPAPQVKSNLVQQQISHERDLAFCVGVVSATTQIARWVAPFGENPNPALYNQLVSGYGGHDEFVRANQRVQAIVDHLKSGPVISAEAAMEVVNQGRLKIAEAAENGDVVKFAAAGLVCKTSVLYVDQDF